MSSVDNPPIRTLQERVPPHNSEAEIATLGALLLDPGDVLGSILSFLRPADFYRRANADVFQAILNLFDRGEEIDQITVTQEMRALGAIERVGGAGYISSLTTAVPTTANVKYYANIVKDHSVRRQLIRTGDRSSQYGL